MTTDDTWHGAGSPAPGDEHDYTGPQPPDFGYSLPRRDPIDDLGAGQAPPTRGLVDFECFDCGVLSKADEDTQECPRCGTRRLGVMTPSDAEKRAAGEVVPYRSPQPSEAELATAQAGLSDAELRDAAVEVKLGPVRARLDDIWAEIASTIVTVAGAGRRAVTQWRSAPDVQAPASVHMAMQELAVSLGMDEGEIADGPLVELLRETAGMMRAEADRAVNGGVLRGQGVARRLREQADVIDTTIGRG